MILKTLTPKKRTSLLLKLFALFAFISFGQTEDNNRIKTVKIISADTPYSRNVHALKNTVTFSFDDIEGNQDEYYYNIIHCNIDWTPSNQPTSYFIEGYANFQINDFENSFGSLHNYTHYKFTLPNENTQITKTGNFIIQILNEDEEIVCERKLILFNQKVFSSITISESRDLENLNQKQATALKINTNSIDVNYPESEIFTFIFQNNDLNNRTPFLKPTFINQNEFIYRPSRETEFFGGNEFYYFDNNEILRNSKFVLRNYREDNYFHSILFPSQSRAGAIYFYNPDINGDFLIRKFNNENPNYEAEYSYVHFTLANKPEFDDLDIHIYGAYNNFALTEQNKLKLDESGKYLTTQLFLKQGFYNYDYVVKRDKSIDRKTISGSYFETENNYHCLVYFQQINSIFYEVVGYGSASSKEQIEN